MTDRNFDFRWSRDPKRLNPTCIHEPKINRLTDSSREGFLASMVYICTGGFRGCPPYPFLWSELKTEIVELQKISFYCYSFTFFFIMSSTAKIAQNHFKNAQNLGALLTWWFRKKYLSKNLFFLNHTRYSYVLAFTPPKSSYTSVLFITTAALASNLN